MHFDPEEIVILTNHGKMKLHTAVTRVMMMLPADRKLATIVRRGEPRTLNYNSIKLLAARWEKPKQPV
jgi:hypothetical protein